tara:strand:- start:188 stop:343 length:156 start_codon:yes stop_codon:yes gene_type:complete
VGSFFDSPEHLRAPTGADVHLRGTMQNFFIQSGVLGKNQFFKDQLNRLNLQ